MQINTQGSAGEVLEAGTSESSVASQPREELVCLMEE